MARRDAPVVRDVWVRNDRWPDSKDLGRWAADCFRIERARTGQQRALALWKWTLICMARGGPPAHEGDRGTEAHLMDTQKYLSVYGTHYCDGLSRLMVNAWRAAKCGQARKTVICRLGHTVAELRYRDADGRVRWHCFDPQHCWCVFSRDGGHIASVAEVAADPELVLYPANPPRPNFFSAATRQRYADPKTTTADPATGMAPAPRHRMRLDLRRGERWRGLWAPGPQYWPYFYGRRPRPIYQSWPEQDSLGGGVADGFLGEHLEPYLYRAPRRAWTARSKSRTPRCRMPGTVELRYAVPLAGEAFRGGAVRAHNVRGEPGAARAAATVHPGRLAEMGELILAVRSPYIITDAQVEAIGRPGSDPLDVLGLFVSTDGGSSWQQVAGNMFRRKGRCSPRPKPLTAAFGQQAYRAGRFSVVGKYGYLLRVDMLARRDCREVGLDALTLTTHCQCNMMALPLLMPGINRVRVTSAAAPRGAKLRVTYEWDETARGPRRARRILPAGGGSFTVRVGGKRPADVRMREVALEVC
jgi:hypothetical protein